MMTSLNPDLTRRKFVASLDDWHIFIYERTPAH